jgi:hypothetical protein
LGVVEIADQRRDDSVDVHTQRQSAFTEQ